jgi:hypothetical protein
MGEIKEKYPGIVLTLLVWLILLLLEESFVKQFRCRTGTNCWNLGLLFIYVCCCRYLCVFNDCCVGVGPWYNLLLDQMLWQHNLVADSICFVVEDMSWNIYDLIKKGSSGVRYSGKISVFLQ